jgi:hypothetical protein
MCQSIDDTQSFGGELTAVVQIFETAASSPAATWLGHCLIFHFAN